MAAAQICEFDFEPTTRVIRGAGALARLGEAVKTLPGRRVLLVTDPGLEAAGHPQRARAALEAAGLAVEVFDEVEENPTTRHVEAGTAFAQNHGTEIIIAVGGGSAMDCAKGINFLLSNGGALKDYWGVAKAQRPMLPSVGVPTTAGTGSEAQSFALICDPETHLKMACGDKKAAFRLALLDPELTLTQPDRVTALTGMDAISHAVESYVTAKRTPLSQMLAREAWRILNANLEAVIQDGANLEARAAMQWGAHLAGMAIENSMLGATHALANPLTAHYGMVHGLAIGLLLPHVVRFNAQAAEDDYRVLAESAGLAAYEESSGAGRMADRLEALARQAGVPGRLRECGVSEGMLSVLADEAALQWTARFNPRPVGYEELLELYRIAF
jgi:alcohol dehydrogenase